MTAGGLSEADVDLLADYVGGALAHTPDETRVRELVRDDPTWAEAYTELVAGSDAVRADLAAWGVEAEPMPPVVFDRLAGALAALSGGPGRDALSGGPGGDESLSSQAPGRVSDSSVRAADASPSTRDADMRPSAPDAEPDPSSRRNANTGPSVRDAGTAPSGRTDRSTGPGRTAGRRQWARAARPLVALALVAAFGGFGVRWLATGGDRFSSDDSQVAAGRGDAGAAPVIRAPSAQRPAASGTDYRPDTLAGALDHAIAAPAAGTADDSATPGGTTNETGGPGAGTPVIGSPRPPGGPKTGDGPQGQPGSGARPQGVVAAGIPTELRRFTESRALDDCLTAVAAEHGAGAVTVQAVDLATYQGVPAVVVVFTDAASARWVWVAGAACGLPAAGADTRYSGPVG